MILSRDFVAATIDHCYNERMEKLILEKLIAYGVKSGDCVGAAVSGGVDSMALLHCLCNLRAELNIIITAYHFEHGIRGQSAVDDMAFVQRECETRGVVCISERADVPALAAQLGLSLETAARKARYAFLDRMQADYIATAHHMDDMAETVLMHLVRGSGLAGLCGIPERRGRYIRPLLDVPRRQIEAYAERCGISFVLDESNNDMAYVRNFVRAQIMPRLCRINDAAAANIARTARLLAQDEAALEGFAQSAGCIETKGAEVYVDIAGLMAQPPAVQRRIIRLAVGRATGLDDVECVHVEDILSLAGRGATAKRIDIGRGVRAHVVYGKLMIGTGRESGYNKESVLLRGTGAYRFENMAFECSMHSGPPVFGQGVEYFDAQAIAGARLRHRLNGDRIRPLGMREAKRLSDYLSDRKVPLHRRDALIVLARGSEVFWVVGVGVSENSKVTDGAVLAIRYGEKRMNKDIVRVLYTERQIRLRVRELAALIQRDFEGEDLLTVGVLRGAVLFYSDLVRELDLPLHMNFMALSSYGASSFSSGAVRIQYDLEEDISGKNVLVVEDIVDSGLTLQYLKNTLLSRGPKRLATCCLFDKPDRRKVRLQADYVGFEVPDVFIVGYGLDYAERYRNLKYIGELDPKIYAGA